MVGPEQRAQEPSSRDLLLARVDEGVRELLAELQQGRSGRLERYLEFSARFHRYSLHNQLLIYLQRPTATFVAGYRKWQQLGYQVAKGEQGIRILAPRPIRYRQPAEQRAAADRMRDVDQGAEPLTEAEPGQVRERVRFVTVSVFDVSQLANVEDKPLPLFFTPLADDQQALCSRIIQVMEEDGIRVSEASLGLTQGSSGRGRVNVREGLDSTSKVLTLLHEYAHELLHWGAEGKARELKVKECHAEAVSFIAAHYWGLHNPVSADYLQHWGNTPQELFAELDVVRRTAAHIIHRIEQSRRTPNAGGAKAGPNAESESSVEEQSII